MKCSLIILFLCFCSIVTAHSRTEKLKDSLNLVDNAQKIDIYSKIIELYIWKREFKEAEKVIKEIKEKNIIMPKVSQQAYFFLLVGMLEYAQNSYNMAEKSFNKVEKLVKHYNARFKYSYKLYLYLGNISWIKGKLSQSLDYYLKAKEVKMLKGESECVVINNIGLIYLAMKRYDEALEYFKVSLDECKKINNKDTEILSYNNIGEVYFEQKKYSKAEIYYLKAYKVCKNRKGQSRLLVLSNLANYYLTTDDLTKSDFYLKKSIAYAQKENNNYINSYNFLLEGLTLSKSNKPSAAIQKFNKTIELEKKMGSVNFFILAYKGLSNTYMKLNKYKEALANYKDFVVMRDSVYNNKIIEQINHLQAKYQSGKKDLELAKQNQQIVKEQYLKYSIIAGILLFIIVSVLFLIKFSEQTRIVTSQNEKLEKINNTKNKFLKIISHDLKSPLVAMVGVTTVLGTEVARMEKNEMREYISILNSSVYNTMSFLDNLLNWAKSQTDSIKISIKKLSLNRIIEVSIILLTQSAENKKIKVMNLLSPNIAVYGDEYTLTTVFRNILSNAIKFTNPEGNITISSNIKKNNVIISITDDGIGMDAERVNNIFNFENIMSTKGTVNEAGTGLGLILCKEFTEKNNGKIWVESEVKKGTIFYFSLKVAK